MPLPVLLLSSDVGRGRGSFFFRLTSKAGLLAALYAHGDIGLLSFFFASVLLMFLVYRKQGENARGVEEVVCLRNGE